MAPSYSSVILRTALTISSPIFNIHASYVYYKYIEQNNCNDRLTKYCSFRLCKVFGVMSFCYYIIIASDIFQRLKISNVVNRVRDISTNIRCNDALTEGKGT